MKLYITRLGVTLEVEGVLEEVFIEEVLGLKEEGEYVRLYRVDVMGTHRPLELSTFASGHILKKAREANAKS